LSDFDDYGVDMDKDVDHLLLEVSMLEAFLSSEMDYQELEKIVWKGQTISEGKTNIMIKTDTKFRAALLGIRGSSDTVLRMQVVRRD
jgi:hypothetical protein